MRSVLLLVASVVGAAMAWPEGQPNCAVAGNWSDPEKTDVVNIVTEEINEQKIQRLVFNTSGVVFNGSAPFEDSRSAVIHAAAANETVILNIVCHNSALWIMLTPSINSNRTIRVLTLNRIPQPPPQSMPVSQQDADPNPSPPPKYLLVNINLPKRSDDDLTVDSYDNTKNNASSHQSEDVIKDNEEEARFANKDTSQNSRQTLKDLNYNGFNKDSAHSRGNDDHSGNNDDDYCNNKGCHENRHGSCLQTNNLFDDTDTPFKNRKQDPIGVYSRNAEDCDPCTSRGDYLTCSHAHKNQKPHNKRSNRNEECGCRSCGKDDCPSSSCAYDDNLC